MSRNISTNFQQITGNTKDFLSFLQNIKVFSLYSIVFTNCNVHVSEYAAPRPDLKFVKIQFNSPVFDRVTKDRAAKFVDQLSAIGGTMGLLTGFSIISGVEIVYFAMKIATNYLKRLKRNEFK